MKRIIIHWTAGGYYPTAGEKKYYHFLVDKDGKIHKGLFEPQDNIRCTAGGYAAHTGGGNTGSIGIAMCAMRGFKNSGEIGNYPITPVQFESAMKLCAELAQQYNIPVVPANVMSHYEFGIKNPNTTSSGKIDVTYIPPYPWVGKNEAGSFMRSKIKWYISKAKEV